MFVNVFVLVIVFIGCPKDFVQPGGLKVYLTGATRARESEIRKK